MLACVVPDAPQNSKHHAPHPVDASVVSKAPSLGSGPVSAVCFDAVCFSGTCGPSERAVATLTGCPPFDAAVFPISVRVLCAPDVARMDGWMPRGGASAAMTTLDGVLRCARWIMTTQDYVGARITSSLCPLVRVEWRRLRPPAAAAVAWNTRPPSSPGMAPDDRRRPSRGERRGASCMCVCVRVCRVRVDCW